MNLAVLVGVVTAGITLIVWVVHLNGGSRSSRLESRLQIAELINQQLYDHHRVTWHAICESGETALFQTEKGKVGLIRLVGKCVTVHLFEAGEIDGVKLLADGFTVSFDIHDLAWPSQNLVFEDIGTAMHVAELLREKSGSLPKLEKQ